MKSKHSDWIQLAVETLAHLPNLVFLQSLNDTQKLIINHLDIVECSFQLWGVFCQFLCVGAVSNYISLYWRARATDFSQD